MRRGNRARTKKFRILGSFAQPITSPMDSLSRRWRQRCYKPLKLGSTMLNMNNGSSAPQKILILSFAKAMGDSCGEEFSHEPKRQ